MKIKNESYAVAAGFILSLSIVLAPFLHAFAEDGALKQTKITGIEVLADSIQIKADAPIRYKLYRPDDPFRITVEIEDAYLGKFTGRMFPDHAGVTEIEPVQILKPAAARLNILLQSPATITPELKDNVLVLTIKTDGRSAGSAMPDAAEKGTGEAEESPAAAGEIVDLHFNKTAAGAELILKGDGEMPDPRVTDVDGGIIIEIPDVLINAPLPRNITPPVRNISYKYEKNSLRFFIDLVKGAKASVDALDDELVVDIASENERPDQAGLPKGEASKMVSFDVQDADIVTIMRLLSDVSGYNIVVHPDVKGKITMKLLNVPWEQALDIILRTFNLDKIIEGNVIRVATVKTFQEEHRAAAETQELFGKTENIETKIFVVNYANVDKVKDAIDKAKILSPRGSLSTDPRTRSIIVKDAPGNLEEIYKLITALDKPTRQVLIEARIVDVSKDFTSELGVQWNGFWTPKGNNPAVSAIGSASAAGSTGVSGSRVITTVPSGTPATPTTFFPNLVNLGTTAPANGAFTLGLLNASQTLGLDLRLSALESNGTGKIISNPKIMTVDNEKAVIRQGQRIPYSTVSQFGTQIQFIDASLDLLVTPQVGPDKSILLNIEVHNNQQGATLPAGPVINTNEATTQVLIKDGETVVIGGVLKTNETDTVDSIPGISKIPLLGALFRHTATTLSTSEQLIFITPRVIEQ